MKEILDLVDEQDRVIGFDTREAVSQKGLHNYRVVGIFLLDENERILLPTRSMNCKLYPGCYDFSVAGHVLHGETYESAAEREAEEELGIQRGILNLKEFLYTLYPNDYGLSSFSKYYYAYYSGDYLKISDEVDSYQWLPISSIERLMESRPKMFKSDFHSVFGYYRTLKARGVVM